MADHRSIDELKVLGAARPAPEAAASLYHRAFAEFGMRALWSSRPVEKPTIADLLAITESLRVEGGVPGRRLAEQIVTACRAAL